MGRIPKPTALKLINGNPGKRPLNENEPKPEVKAPAMPEFLEGEERAAWKYLSRELGKMGTLASSDRADMVVYCHFWNVAVEAKKKLSELKAQGNGVDPKVIKTQGGNFIQNPWLGIANHAMKELARISAQLGLNPTERSRISINGEKENDEEKRFFG